MSIDLAAQYVYGCLQIVQNAQSDPWPNWGTAAAWQKDFARFPLKRAMGYPKQNPDDTWQHWKAAMTLLGWTLGALDAVNKKHPLLKAIWGDLTEGEQQRFYSVHFAARSTLPFIDP